MNRLVPDLESDAGSQTSAGPRQPVPSRIAPLRRLLRLRQREAAILRGLLILATLLLILGGVAYALAGATPSWWADAALSTKPLSPQPAATAGSSAALPAPTDPAQLATLLENALLTELSKVRPLAAGEAGQRGESEPWAIRITQDELNTWLNAKLPRWLEGEPFDASGFVAANTDAAVAAPAPRASPGWARQLRELRVRFTDGQITIGARMGAPHATQRISWIQFRPELREGDLWLLDACGGIGRLPTPIRLLLFTEGGSPLEDPHDPADTRPPNWSGRPARAPTLRTVLEGAGPAIAAPHARLLDGRHVRLIDIKVEGTSVLLGFETTAK